MANWRYDARMRAVLLALLLAACASPPREDATVSLTLAWRVSGFANPESVALAQDGATLYVTNVNGEGEAKDGNGFVSRVSLSGQMLERNFATGLDGPKGIARNGDTLYVADIDQVAIIDASTGIVRRRVPMPGAQFLNDVAVAPDGLVLVADSATRRIYSFGANRAPEAWLEHPLLEAINGLLPEPDRLVVTTMAGRLLAISYQTKEISLLAEGLGDADGLAPIGDGRYLVSEWPGRMQIVSPGGAHAAILETAAEGRYLNDFLLLGDMLYQPHWEPSELSAYHLSGVHAD